MRAAQMYEEDEDVVSGSDTDLHLGMGSLIGIFFGLTLVCGVFFGFGYTMGHRTPGTYVASEPLYEKPPSVAVAPKPSGQVLAEPTEASRVVIPAAPVNASAQADSMPATATPEKVSATPPKPAPTLAPKPQPVAAKAVVSPPPSAPQPALAQSIAPQLSTGTIMVQIAAVKNRPDAEALAVALQKDGFHATVRTEAQDKLLHVQVGPFDNRDEAKAMRQKLAGAGYNAFIK